MEITRVTYPQVSIWNNHVAQLEVVNVSDLHIFESLKALGIEDESWSLLQPVSDLDEIGRRQNLLRFLIDNGGFRQCWLRHTENLTKSAPIDLGGLEWLRFSDPSIEHTPYWERLAEFEKFLYLQTDPAFPEPIRQIRDVVRDIRSAEKLERLMAADVRKLLLGMVSLEGIVKCRLSMHRQGVGKLELVSHSCVGHDSYVPMTTRRATRFESLPLVGRVVKARNERCYNRQLRKHLVRIAPKEVLEDIISGVLGLLAEEAWTERASEDIDGATIFIHFEYGTGGMEVQVEGLELVNKQNKRSFEARGWSGYTAGENRIRTDMEHAISAERAAQQDADRRDALRVQLKRLRIPCRIPSPRSDAKYHNSTIKELLRKPEAFELDQIYRAATGHRAWLGNKLQGISRIIKIADALAHVRQSTDLPMSFPKMKEDGGISFGELWPVQLLTRHKVNQLAPIVNMPQLDSNLVAVTGGNAVGKSVALQSIATGLWFAHTGLPIFGEAFETSILNTLGVLTLERGEGSTVELMLLKLTEIFESLQENEGRSLLVLDELGSATQEELGLELGQDVLRTTSGIEGCSTLFCTQILELARWAKSSLGASCVQIDSKHRFADGIAAGDIENLRERTGIDRFLKKGGQEESS